MKKLVFITLLIFSLALIYLPSSSAEWTSEEDWSSGGFGGKDFGGRYSGFIEPHSQLTAFVDYGGKIVSEATLGWEWAVTSPYQANLTLKVLMNGVLILTNENVTSGEGSHVIEDPTDSYSFLLENDNDFGVFLWLKYSGHSDMPLDESIALILGLALGIIVPITIILLLYYIFGIKMKKKVDKYFPPAAISVDEELIKPDQKTTVLLEEELRWLDKVTKLTGWVFFTIFMEWVFAFYVLPVVATFSFYEQASTMTTPEWMDQWMQLLGIFLGPLFMAGFPLLLVLYWFYYYESKHESNILKAKIEKLLGRTYSISTGNTKKGMAHLFIIYLFILLIMACPTVSAQSDSDDVMNQAFLVWIINIIIFAFVVFTVYYYLPKRKPVLDVKEIPEHVGIAEMLLISVTYISRRLDSMSRWSLGLIVPTCLLGALMLIPLVVVFQFSALQIAILSIFLLIILLGLFLWYRIFKHSQDWKKRLQELDDGMAKLIE